MCDAPILFIIFNRPDLTRKVFQAIRQARPRSLFVAADGPRPDNPDDREQCAEVRSIIGQIDWDCEVKTLFREQNLGCRQAVATAIDWFFSQVEEGIVLEDDCLPDPSFFPYCVELLELYRNEERVMQICGSNFQKSEVARDCSYYFSLYGPVWGWASWRRAWARYDIDLKLWPKVKADGLLKEICLTPHEVEMRTVLYDRLHNGEIDTWDYQWGFAKMINSGLSVTPEVNLISNIGFGAGATHTTGTESPFADLPVTEMSFPLTHPQQIGRDLAADRIYVTVYAFPESKAAPVIPAKSVWRRIWEKF